MYFSAMCMCHCRRQKNVDETLALLRAKGLTVSGMVCHVGSAQHRQALVDRTIQVTSCYRSSCIGYIQSTPSQVSGYSNRMQGSGVSASFCSSAT
jgi:hypothetical protein